MGADPAALHSALRQAYAGSALAVLLMLGFALGWAWWLHRAWAQQWTAAVRLARSLDSGSPTDPAREDHLVGKDDASSAPALFAALHRAGERLSSLWRAQRAQAARVRALQHVAQTDEATGLWRRGPFVARLQRVLDEATGPGCGLLLIRLPELGELNEQHGRRQVDLWLRALGETLAEYPRQAGGTFVGRLNGHDLVLCLPLVGLAKETAVAVHEALSLSGRAHIDKVAVHIGGVDGLRGIPAGLALAAADSALAQAELSHEIVVDWHAQGSDVPQGAAQWRREIAMALDEGRLQLSESAVLGPSGALVHLAAEPALALRPHEPPLPGRRWLALASRGALLVRAESLALQRVLQACGEDGLPRSMRLSASSIVRTVFQQDVMQQLRAAGSVAGRVVLEIDAHALAEPDAHAQAQANAQALLAWLAELPCAWAVALGRATLDSRWLQAPVLPVHVRLEGGLVQGLAQDVHQRQLVAAIAESLQRLAVAAIASDVLSGEDLDALWRLGVRGACGPAVVEGR
jgi:GGDEF domain-containing protein/EAL domain-containing protein (putative c-di-GMP-specific phosphodiesterase class I)